MTIQYSNEIAENVSKILVHKGFVVHRYDSFSTSSIYLKLDYGVSNSIRIADHPGKKYLRYRFNIITSDNSSNVFHREQEGIDRIFYGSNACYDMINDICAFKESQIKRYGLANYKKYMEINKLESVDKKGFWDSAKLIGG
jgi:hypothetical protein